MEECEVSTENLKKEGRGALVYAITVGVLSLVYLAVCTYAYLSPKIFPNTSLCGVSYAGLTEQQAEERLASLVAAGKEKTVTFSLADGTEVIAVQPNIEVDTAKAARIIAVRGGAEDGFFAGGVHFLRALLTGYEPIYYPAEDTALWPLADKVFEALACEPVEFSGAISENGVTFTKAKDGRAARSYHAEQEMVLSALRQALYSGTDVAATLSEGKEYDVLPAQEADLAAFRRSVIGGSTNAYYDIENAVIVPESIGVTMTLEELTAAYEAAVPGETSELAVTVNRAEVTAEMLEEGLFRDKLATYTTYAYGPAGRQTNVRLAAEKCGSVILNAGDIFDYSVTLGPVTPSAGYQPAPGYIQGKTVDVTGGGICQVSSTIYAAALHANLEIVERTAHGFASSYIGLGLDATVADNGPQFRLRNNTLYPIKIETIYAKNNNVTVNIWGTKTDDTYVKIESVVRETTPYGEVFEETDTLAPGETKVEQDPYTGYKVDTYRCVYAGDGTLLSRTYEAYSRYKARDRITLVGKAAEETPAAPTETPAEVVTPDEPVVQETPAETPADSAPDEVPVLNSV